MPGNITPMQLSYLEDLWRDEETAGLDEAGLLRYRSNLLGRDLRITNFGGGNTSAKIVETDTVTGEQAEVLWVKGSGGDLGTIRLDGFATLYLARLRALKSRYRGPEYEDEMAELYPLCAFGANTRAASIDTPLHAFLPFRHVDHLHPDWAIALAASANGVSQLERLREESGLRLVWLPWKRPGFELGLWLERAVAENPGCDGIVLGSHGLFTWGETSRESYRRTIEIIDRIGRYVLARIEAKGSLLFGGAAVSDRSDRADVARAVLPALRGLLGPAIGHFDDRAEILRFVNSAEAAALARQGTSCPDHFVRTKVRPLLLDWNPGADHPGDLAARIRGSLEAYREEYRLYYEENRRADSPPMRSQNPSVVLLPGVGMFTFGRTKTEARITGEFYTNAIHVIEGATAMDDLPADPSIPVGRVVNNYVALAPREAFDIEYWQLEEAKLRRMPQEKELSRKVALVVGASPGIGAGVASRLADEGAHIVIADIDGEIAEAAAGRLRGRFGSEVAAGERVDCADRESVRRLLRATVLLYGGVDIVVQTAAVFFPPDDAGRIGDAEWRKTFDVNLMGSMVLADEAGRLMREQGTDGSIVLLSSANAVVPKRGSWAYDAAKSGLNHLIRELSLEFAPRIRVNGVAPASVVEGSRQFPRERILSSLKKYGIPHEESEGTGELRERLSGYYAQRTLLKERVTPADVAEAVFLLASRRLGVTTGHIVPVDAGLPEAFLR